MKKANIDIRDCAKSEKIPFWLIADKLGVSEPTFIRWLRKEFTEERKEQIRNIIADLKKEEA